MLDDVTLQTVAPRKSEGHTNAEIVRALGCVEATVERELKRIRGLWRNALDEG